MVETLSEIEQLAKILSGLQRSDSFWSSCLEKTNREKYCLIVHWVILLESRVTLPLKGKVTS